MLRTLVIAVAMSGLGGTAVFDAVAADASSVDGRWVLAGEGATVVVRDQGHVVKVLPARSLDGREAGAVRSVHFLVARRSFLITFDAGLLEAWELSVDPAAPPVHDGLVHDFRLGEAIGAPGFLGVRRIRLDAPLLAVAFDDSGAYMLGQTRFDGQTDLTRLVLINLDVRRAIASWKVDAEPAVANAFNIQRNGRALMLLPDRRGGPPIEVDPRSARLLAPGPAQGD